MYISHALELHLELGRVSLGAHSIGFGYKRVLMRNDECSFPGLGGCQ